MEAQRSTMINSQLRTIGVNDPAVLAAVAAVGREKFMPAGRASLAYADALVPIAAGRTMIEPMILALLLSHLRIQPGEKVLVIGCGTGYSAALVTQLTTRSLAIESNPALASFARNAGIAVTESPLSGGDPSGAPYDVILIDGAVAQLPAALLAQLREGGRLGAVIIGDDGVGRATTGAVFAGHFTGNAVLETATTLLPGFERPRQFVF